MADGAGDTFTDAAGREWSVRLTFGLLTEVREATGIALGEVLRSEAALAGLLFGDVEALGRLLWCVCREQAEARQVSPEDFARGFDGPAVERATEALLRGVANFFPRSKIGAALRANLDAILARADAAGVAAMDKAIRSQP